MTDHKEVTACGNPKRHGPHGECAGIPLPLIRDDEQRFELLPPTYETRGSDPGWFFWLLAAALVVVSIWATVLYVHWLAS